MLYDCSVISRRLVLAALVPLGACAPTEDSHAKAFLGAMLLDGSGGPPLSNSIVVTAGARIRAAGARSAVPVPADADQVDGSGKVLVPAPVDVRDRAEPAALVRASSPGAARAAVETVAARRPSVAYLDETSPEIAAAVLEAARAVGIPVLARVSTQSSAAFLVDHGVSGLIGMIADTEALDPALLSRLRDLKIAVAPALLTAGAGLESARHNTLQMFRAGVPMAAASLGGDFQRELELMADAGIPPLDVVVAATRNSAAVLHLSDCGTIEAGKRADLLLLSANPGADIANLRQVSIRLSGGEWVGQRH
jgi:imidazolonepropionase-like amidohydrolase